MTTTSSDSENVFWLYERNKNEEYNNCIKLCKPCPNLFGNDCCCDSDDPVLPLTIGEQTTKCRFKVKTYIKFGEECPICFDPIKHKSNAYLTGCGHAFHRKCLFNTIQAKWETKPFSTIKCPMCRAALGYPEMFERYVYSYERDNFLDRLEDFWLSKEFRMPEFCSTGKHYLGMKNNCHRCLDYRNTGDVY